MGDTVKIGVRVDEDVYEEFRQFVESRHNRTHGVLGTELENAMRDRMSASSPTEPIQRIENDVATIKAMLADAEADGGEVAPTPVAPESTHTDDSMEPNANQDESGDKSTSNSNSRDTDGTKADPNGRQSEPPHAKASRAEKAEWVVGELADEDRLHIEKDIRRTVAETWSFGEDATDALVDAVVGRLDREPHPNVDNLLLTDAAYDEAVEELREIAEEEADEELQKLDL